MQYLTKSQAGSSSSRETLKMKLFLSIASLSAIPRVNSMLTRDILLIILSPATVAGCDVTLRTFMVSSHCDCLKIFRSKSGINQGEYFIDLFEVMMEHKKLHSAMTDNRTLNSRDTMQAHQLHANLSINL